VSPGGHLVGYEDAGFGRYVGGGMASWPHPVTAVSPHSGGVAMVAMPGPVDSSVWALDECGDWLCLRWSGKYGAWMDITSNHAGVSDQRAFIVRGMAVMERRRRWATYRFVPPVGERWSLVASEASEAYDQAVMATLVARFWEELYGVTRTD